MKVKTRQKLSSLAISAIMLIAMFAMVPAAFADQGVNSVRLYGEGGMSAAFPYTDPEAPFDPLNDESPEKDFMTFNPALLENRIVVSNVDSKQKVFARQWFVPEYEEPTGDVWLEEPNKYYSQDIVTEYTYMFVDKHYEPTEATALSLTGAFWTKFWFPVADNDDSQIGLDGYDIDGDGTDDMVTLISVEDSNYYNGKDIAIASKTFQLEVNDTLQFLDHMIVIKDVHVLSGTPPLISIMVDVYYTGNGVPELMEENYVATILPGQYLTAGRHTLNYGNPSFDEPWFLQAVAAGTDNAYVRVGRLLHTGETFFVDGAEYDISMIFGSEDDSVKYITIRNPIPEHDDVDLQDLSVIKESVLPDSYLPLLPPFNREHTMVDDINIPEYAEHDMTYYLGLGHSDTDDDPYTDPYVKWEYDTVGERKIYDVPALNIYYTEKGTETRFHTDLMEILDVEYSHDPVDILFEIDVTGSMGPELAAAKAQSVAIMNAIKAVHPNANFGLVSFSDYPEYYSYPENGGYGATYGGPEDSPYTLDQPITGNTAVVAAAINGLALGWGADWPEDYTRVLYEAGNDTNINWRPGALQIVVVIGDAPTHDIDFYGVDASSGGDPGRNATAGDGDDLDFETTVAGLASQGIIVMAIDASMSPSPNPGYDAAEIAGSLDWSTHPDAAEMSFRYMADETGGEYCKLDNAEDIGDVIVDLLSDYAVVDDEDWQWLHIRTMPDEYKVFVYPELPDIDDGYGDFLLTSSLRAPNSNYDAPDDGMHSEPQRFMMVYDQVNGLPDIYVNENVSGNDNGLRLYGQGDISANFPYDNPEAPFDPLHIEAPEKDFVTLNPALVKAGIFVDNVDSKEKVFLRQWFVPKYKEPTGDVWLEEPNIYISEDVVSEYTYMFIDKYYMPTEATSLSSTGAEWTKFWLPIADNDDSQIGIDGCDVDGDGQDDMVVLKDVGFYDDINGLDDGRKDITIATTNFQVQVNDELTFLDHMVVVKDLHVVSGDPMSLSLVVDVYYIGNDMPELIQENYMATVLPDDYLSAGRHTLINGAPTFTEPWFLQAVATGEDNAYISVGRLLHTGETFFVDGAEYDIAMIFGAQCDSVKYITIRNPIPEHDDVNLEDLSVIKESVADNETMPMLPPFNRVHTMIDDIGVPEYGNHWMTYYAEDNTDVGARMFEDVPPLEIRFTGKDIEPRFHTNLLELLKVYPRLPGDEHPHMESWKWLHIHTMPDFYKEFVYPDVPNVAGGYGDYLVTSSLVAPNSDYEAPEDGMHPEPQRFMFAFEPTDGSGIYMADPITLEPPVDDTPEEFDSMVYDANEDGVIDRPEVVAAILDFLDERITRSDVVAVIIEFLG